MISRSVDWPALAQTVALELLGDPIKRTRREWRWGRKGSMALYLAKGTWRDFEAGQGGGVMDLIAHLQGVDRRDAVTWLQERGLLPPPDVQRVRSAPGASKPPSSGRAPARPPQDSGNSDEERRLQWPRRTWASASVIPRDAGHPARRWMAVRHLWRTELPAPATVRWLPSEAHHPARHTGAGSIVALAAPPAAWQAAWPDLPNPQAVQLIAVDQAGSPAAICTRTAGALGKQTRGALAGAVVVTGNPCPDEAVGPIRVAEGLADALALAARYEGPAEAVLGTAGMRAQSLLDYLASWFQGVVVHADADGAGGRAAGELRRRVVDAGGSCRALMPAQGEDPADAASGIPLEDLPEGWQDYAVTLREMYPDWPRWEVYRAASVALGS